MTAAPPPVSPLPTREDPQPLSDTTTEWAIVELFGHVRTAGRISEVERFGGKMMRLDVPGDGGGIAATQYLGNAALYRVTVTTEEIARQVAQLARPEPVHRWELTATAEAVDDAEDGVWP